jgi:fermentation-respiration switch protein FrsA (DUF1100 family)
MDNLACVAAFRRPLLIVHGTRDDVLDFGYGQALAAAAPTATFVTPDCDHNGCDYFRSAVGLAIRDWLARATPPPR